jgi:multidrug efflux pump
MSVFRFSVRNTVLVNLLMIAVVVVGLIALMRLPRELFPKITINWVFVITNYPGVSAEDVEKQITIPIEDDIADIEGIDFIWSGSTEGQSFIAIKFLEMSDSKYQRRLQDLKSKVNEVKDLPDDADDPIIQEMTTANMVPVITVNLTADLPERQLTDLAEELKDRLSNISTISSISMAGTRDRQIWVEVDPDQLYAYRLPVSQVIAALAMRRFNMPGGKLRLGREEYVIRTMSELTTPEEIKNIVIRTIPGSRALTVGDVATVKDTYEDPQTYSRLDGKPNVAISIAKTDRGNSLKIIADVKRVCQEFAAELPPSARIVMTNDNSIYIRDVLSKLVNNGLFGLLMVFLILLAFLGWRNAVFASLGIPVTFMAAFIMMQFMGETLNGTALFGLVLVLGVVVDDAIIILENSYRYMQKGLSPRQAAVIGGEEVMMPVLTSTLTTIAAFLPLMMMTGVMGKFMRIVPVVVSIVLVASLFEAFVILPAHIADWTGKGGRAVGRVGWIRQLNKLYSKVLYRFLKRRYIVLVAITVLLLVGVWLTMRVGVDLYNDEEVPAFFVWIRMPEGTQLDATSEAVARVEKTAMGLSRSEWDAVVGTPGFLQTHTETIYQPHVGMVIVDLVERKDRDRSAQEIMDDLRNRIGSIPGVKSIELAQIQSGPPVGSDVDIKVMGKNFEDLEAVTEVLKGDLNSIDGVHDISDNFSPGTEELRVIVDPQKSALYGLDVQSVSLAVRTAFDGVPATVMRDEDEELDVLVRYPEDRRGTIEDLAHLYVVSPTGVLVPFSAVCSIDRQKGISDIQRFKRQRAITITANLDKSKTDMVRIKRQIDRKFASIATAYPGVNLDYTGAFQEYQEAFAGIMQLFAIGIFLIYIILGGQFRSFIQPIVIMCTIPFAFMGAVVGLLMSGNPFSITTLYGIVALGGIVVNDAIVMVTFINNARREGMGRWKSVMQAGQIRLRPILLTSITTIFGVLPMAIGLGGKSEVWAPLANTIAWGLGAATFLTLLILPTIFCIVVDDIGGVWRRSRARRNGVVQEESNAMPSLQDLTML